MRKPDSSDRPRIILAIEAAVNGGNLSLHDQNGVIASWHGATDVSRAEELLSAIAQLIKQTAIDRTAVDSIAVSNGAGSYTGIRIGLATALGLGSSLEIECFGVPLLAAIAAAYPQPAGKIVAVPIGRNEVCWQTFHGAENSRDGTRPRAGTREDLLEELINLPDSSLIMPLDDVSGVMGSERRIIECGRNLSLFVGMAAQNSHFTSDLRPFYVQNSRLST